MLTLSFTQFVYMCVCVSLSPLLKLSLFVPSDGSVIPSGCFQINPRLNIRPWSTQNNILAQNKD